MTNSKSDRQIRYAVVGLGWFAQEAALPAFAHSENSKLVALVSDDPEKLEELSQKYGVDHTYSYEEYEDCLASDEIDAVYIALEEQKFLTIKLWELKAICLLNPPIHGKEKSSII